MNEGINLEKIIEQIQEMLKPGEFNLFLNRLEREPLQKRVNECCKNGKYELKFRINTFCGLSFIHQRYVQCPYLDFYGKIPPIKIELTNFHKYRIYACRREKVIFKTWFNEK